MLLWTDMDQEDNSNSQEIDDVMPQEESIIELDRKGRGTASLEHLAKLNPEERLEVFYNKFGQPIGASRVDLASYRGFLARSMVPITYGTWHKVPKSIKENLWTAVKVRIYTFLIYIFFTFTK